LCHESETTREIRISGAPGGTSSSPAAFEPAINGSKGRYAKPDYTTGATNASSRSDLPFCYNALIPDLSRL